MTLTPIHKFYSGIYYVYFERKFSFVLLALCLQPKSKHEVHVFKNISDRLSLYKDIILSLFNKHDEERKYFVDIDLIILRACFVLTKTTLHTNCFDFYSEVR